MFMSVSGSLLNRRLTRVFSICGREGPRGPRTRCIFLEDGRPLSLIDMRGPHGCNKARPLVLPFETGGRRSGCYKRSKLAAFPEFRTGNISRGATAAEAKATFVPNFSFYPSPEWLATCTRCGGSISGCLGSCCQPVEVIRFP